MLLTELYKWIKRRSFNAGKTLSPREINIIISKTAGIPVERLLTHDNIRIEPPVFKKISHIVEKRLENYPLQYLLGTIEFMCIDFLISPGVLIPRPETELVVQTALKLTEQNNYIDLLDLCCGSGVIGLSIARMNKHVNVCLSDISPKAVALAKKNSKKLRLSRRTRFYTGDLFSALSPSRRFDLIVSNPPYVPHNRISRLQKEILYEPVYALDGGKKGMEIITRIIGQAHKFLRKNGILVMEHDDTQKKYLEKICTGSKPAGLEYVETANDLSGLPRFSIFSVRI